MVLKCIYFVFFEERSTNVAIERIGEVLSQVLESFLHVVVLFRVVDGHDEQIDEPNERVLVHGLDVGQVGNREEENGRVHGYGTIAESCLVDLLLGLFGDRLLLQRSKTKSHLFHFIF